MFSKYARKGQRKSNIFWKYCPLCTDISCFKGISHGLSLFLTDFLYFIWIQSALSLPQRLFFWHHVPTKQCEDVTRSSWRSHFTRIATSVYIREDVHSFDYIALFRIAAQTPSNRLTANSGALSACLAAFFVRFWRACDWCNAHRALRNNAAGEAPEIQCEHTLEPRTSHVAQQKCTRPLCCAVCVLRRRRRRRLLLKIASNHNRRHVHCTHECPSALPSKQLVEIIHWEMMRCLLFVVWHHSPTILWSKCLTVWAGSS